MGSERVLITSELPTGEFIAIADPGSVDGLDLEKVRTQLEDLLSELYKDESVTVSSEAFGDILRPKYKSVYPVFVFHADSGFELVGYGELHQLTQATGRTGIIENVMVKPEYHGRKIGSLIMEKLLGIAFLRGLNSVELTSAPHRVVARALYKKLGFKERASTIFILALE